MTEGRPAAVPLRGCAKLRQEVERACGPVAGLRVAAQRSKEELARARAVLHVAETAHAAARQAGDARAVREAKLQAQRTYRKAADAATDEADLRAAATTWLRAIDRLNHDARRARLDLGRAQGRVSEAAEAVRLATAQADAQRIRAETAADACQEARLRLAGCEEQEHGVPGATSDDAPWDEDAGRPDEEAAPVDDDRPLAGPERPLVIQQLLRGDRDALRTLSVRLAEATGEDATSLMLLLSDLIEALAGAAADEGFLDFERRHSFWGQFTRTEARGIVRALSGMGFRLGGDGRWAGDREPGMPELSLALAHAGYDTRGLRGLPGRGAVRGLFDGASVATEEFVASRVPTLGLERVLAALGSRAEPLDRLWDAWGRLRPLLLAPADA